MRFTIRFLFAAILIGSCVYQSVAQELSRVIPGPVGEIERFEDSAENSNLPSEEIPLFSFKIDDRLFSTIDANLVKETIYTFNGKVNVEFTPQNQFNPGWKGKLVFENVSDDTLSISNVVPFGESSDHLYITGKGNHPLSRTHLFRPGYEPVNVILPDNAWELGYSDIPLDGNRDLCSLVRRDSWDEDKAEYHRFSTDLAPGGTVTYNFYADLYTGRWQEGLRKIFQDRYLYDVETFDNSMFERDDLDWIRHDYIMHLMMAWNQQYFYDRSKGKYQLVEFLDRGEQLYGGDDVIGIWPTWPSLGLDQRNQWDMYRSLPGGLDMQNELAKKARAQGTKYFISYNPWDQSTRMEAHLDGMATLIDGISADGVVLDTRGSSSEDLQNAADSVRDGVVMYSEGMAVPKDMQNIVAGRVHNALYYPPLLNLNKFIKPDFAIFRVAELARERIRREYAVSFFNGYGTEINIFRPGIPSWVEENYQFLGHTTRILRENSSNFLQDEYTPLIPTLTDSIYVNQWPKDEKTIYTIFSIEPRGFQGPLFEINPEKGYHFVDLWNHKEIRPDTVNGKIYAPVDLGSFNKKWLGTNNEGAVGAIAKLPKVLNTELKGDKLTFSGQQGNSIKVWAGRPDYEKTPVVFDTEPQTIRLTEHFGVYEGKFVIQLFKDQELLDENIVRIQAGKPRLVSTVDETKPAVSTPEGMVKIPAGSFTMQVSQGDQFIPYPTEGYPKEITLPAFYMDKHPVTNAEFKVFLDATGYEPENPTSFLKHWNGREIPVGRMQHPVIYVSYEDAKAYADWAGKRLPTEAEWQYAAQTSDVLEWPWQSIDTNINVKVEKKRITNTLETTKYIGIDSTVANLGNGKLDPVGYYPKGENPYGLQDLVGSVWQMTNDLYKNGSYSFVMLKGGSYYKPTSSWWYVEGGPRKLHYRQIWLRVSPGFERNATVGFRCVKNAK